MIIMISNWFLLMFIGPYHHILDLCCPNTVTAHVDDVIQASGDLVVAFLGAVSAVSSEEIT